MKPGTSRVFSWIFVVCFVGSLIFCTREKQEPVGPEGQEEPFLTVIPTADKAFQLISGNKQDSAFVILDVRTSSEYKNGHIEGALNLSVNSGDFESGINKLNKNATYLVYCQNGGRSSSAAGTMQNAGFLYIYNFTGSMTAWLNAGYPVVKDD